jgi:hypothetical protein
MRALISDPLDLRPTPTKFPQISRPSRGDLQTMRRRYAGLAIVSWFRRQDDAEPIDRSSGTVRAGVVPVSEHDDHA